jgi:hypothetical protein
MKILKIVKKRCISGPVKVYDFTVNEDHHYILVNGLISHNSYVPMKQMGGGGGLKFAASTIVYLSKKKIKDEEKDVIGNEIVCTLYKSRQTRENSKISTKLSYDTGLDPYYGLIDIALEAEVFKIDGKRILLPDGSKVFQSKIEANPKKYFTDEILKQIDEGCEKIFKYGASTETEVVEEDEDNE